MWVLPRLPLELKSWHGHKDGRTSVTIYNEGSSQRLKRDDARENNQDRKANKADVRYLLQYLGGQKESSARNKRSTIPAVELAAASNIRSRSYPITYNDDQQYSQLPNRALDQDGVSIKQSQSETPWNDQTHDSKFHFLVAVRFLLLLEVQNRRGREETVERCIRDIEYLFKESSFNTKNTKKELPKGSVAVKADSQRHEEKRSRGEDDLAQSQN
ncbi:hypothetical protein ACH5RR_022121 [Cinchona calisaya]|uniref:Uncharacterized protein n=1 Tax=Cinchona calisaya TaxID=153742 RepID=A0ABD2Z6X2_9GENT